ncbi:glutathione S-transferase family protein [Allosphingosinicella vermicomposti]|uniref:glutathione S-transferase family protein n=1 Tax=Allosphingosinicella vermicomposti TaxID=614671 RepID=UPI000D106FD6|nr:glutathione S-transferase family protein [Allosphingosinicella vermicomposti]
MALELFAHPFSSYCQKVLTALYENGTPFDYRALGPDEPDNGARFAALWPIGKFPMLVDDGRMVAEASVIVEYLDLHHAGPVRFVPEDREAALEIRMMDRVFDNYVMTPMQRIVADFIRLEADRDPINVAEAKALLDRSYAWLDQRLDGREWGAGEAFTLADCAAAPSLFYADWVHPIPEACGNLKSYRARLLARPAFARAVDEARPYRDLFPPGAPDRD